MKIKITIADDHPLVIKGLHNTLSNCKDMEIIASYRNGKELLDGFLQQQPDVLLLDINMPGQTGDEIAEIISEQYPKVKMLALTSLNSIYYLRNMLSKGVLGYILKTTEEEILLEAIRTVYKGEQFLEPVLKEKIIKDSLQLNRHSTSVPVLSRREKEVLRYIASDLTSQQIADKLFVSKRTIDSHRLSLLMKMDVKNVAALVKKAIQLGLIE